jgi:hypothetical protein
MDKEVVRMFTYKVRSHLTDKSFNQLPFVFPNTPVPTFAVASARVTFLSGIEPALYDCCLNSCCCFVGPHKSKTECPFCQAPRFNAVGNARKRFTHIPVIPRLVALFKNNDYATKMQYRAHEHAHKPGFMTDIFDGEEYRSCLQRQVSVDGKEMGHTFFSNNRDIALGLATDGFAPFRKRKMTAWPLILFNYNLPPEIRFHMQYIICVGVIPGPKKPKDCDSFLWPLVNELLQLEGGIPAYDTLRKEMFLLRSHLITVFGDIPAVSMVMLMKGQNGLLLCRMCNIRGVRIPGARFSPHYVPLDHSCHPSVSESDSEVKEYDAANLPLRTHAEILDQGCQVQSADSKADAGRLSKNYGVKGVSILSQLSSLSFPASFPYDFMHLIWENLVKNLSLLWTGAFKGLDDGCKHYKLDKKVWEAIGRATAASGSTIPSAFGARPPNIESDKTACTADTWSFWMLYLGPVLLHHKFTHQKYYEHFIKLVKLLNLCLQFELTDEDVEMIRQGFIKWVKKYEQYAIYLQGSMSLHAHLTIVTVYITSLHLSASLHAPSPFTPYYTLQTTFVRWVLCGRLGPFRSSASVENSNGLSKVADFHSVTLMVMS